MKTAITTLVLASFALSTIPSTAEETVAEHEERFRKLIKESRAHSASDHVATVTERRTNVRSQAESASEGTESASQE
jgi:hypothetical protein